MTKTLIFEDCYYAYVIDVTGFLELGLIKFSLKRTAIFHIEPSR